MEKPRRELARAELPNWFRVVGAAILSITAALLAFAVFMHNRGGATLTGAVVGAVVLSFYAFGAYAVRYLYSRYVATETGIDRQGPFGERQHVPWPDVIRVTTPRFVLKGVVRVVSTTGESITVPKGLPGYPELIKVLHAQAPQLRGKSIPPDAWPQGVSWLGVLITAVVVLVVYLLLKILYVTFDK